MFLVVNYLNQDLLDFRILQDFFGAFLLKNFCYLLSEIINHISKEHTGAAQKIRKKKYVSHLSSCNRRSLVGGHGACFFASIILTNITSYHAAVM
jgi:hypothetical protein